MKKKIIISIIICLIIVIGLISYNIWDNRVVSIITLDINPSIEIKLNRKEKVVSVVALNSDAKEVISNDLKGKKLDKALGMTFVFHLPFFTIALFVASAPLFYWNDDSFISGLFFNIGCLFAIIYYGLYIINMIIEAICSIKGRKKNKNDTEINE